MKNLSEFINDYCCYGITINCNDTFYYASADQTQIDSMDIKKLLEIESKYGHAGVVAFCAKIRKEEPLVPYLTPHYVEAKKELESYILFDDVHPGKMSKEEWKEVYNRYSLVEEK